MLKIKTSTLSILLSVMVSSLMNNGVSQEISLPTRYFKPRLENDEYNRKFQEAREYKASTIYYHNGSFRNLSGGVGPDYLTRPDNGNVEFPWGKAGGTFDALDCTTRKFVWFPPGSTISTLHGQPILGYDSSSNFGTDRFVVRDRGPTWTYPVGTIFFAVLAYKGMDFEVHMLEKGEQGQGIDSYDGRIWRPYPSLDDFKKVLPATDSNVRPQRVRSVHVHSIGHKAFDETFDVVVLPPLSVDYRELLDRPFKDATGVFWQDTVTSPTTNSPNHIIPPGFSGFAIGHDIRGCKNCHSHVGQHVTRFELFRDWYGRIRGSDGIFSYTLGTYSVRDASTGHGYKLEAR